MDLTTVDPWATWFSPKATTVAPIKPYIPPPRLTFGVEIEFLVAFTAESQDDPDPDDGRPVKGWALDALDEHETGLNYTKPITYRHIAATLTAAGLPTIWAEDDWGINCRHAPAEEKEKLKTHWVLVQDGSLSTQDETYWWLDCEISSPPMEFTELSLAIVKDAIEAITAFFRVITNETCGLHVHVGNHNERLPLPTLKNLGALIWTFEDQLAQIHPLHRTHPIDASTRVNYGAGLAKKSNLRRFLARENPSWTRYQIRARGLEMILASKANEQVIEYLTGQWLWSGDQERIAYNFLGLRIPPVEEQPNGHRNKPTIEFRIHEGSVEEGEVDMWCRVCCGLVGKAFDVLGEGQQAFEAWLGECADKSVDEVGLVEVLRKLGMEKEAVWYGLVVEAKRVTGELRDMDDEDAEVMRVTEGFRFKG